MGFFRLPSLAPQEKKDEAIREAKAIADQEMDKVTLGLGAKASSMGLKHFPDQCSLGISDGTCW